MPYPIRILFVDGTSKFGGGPNYLLHIIDAINKNKYYPIVICSDENLILIDELRKRNTEFFPLKIKISSQGGKIEKFMIRFPNFLNLIIKISRIIKKGKIDIIQANLFYSALFSSILAILHRKPFIWIAQTPSDLLQYKTLTKFLILCSKKTILTCNDFIKIAKEGGLNTSNFQTIYGGLREEELYRKKENLANKIDINGRKIKKPIVAMIARFDRYQKGHQYFIEAARIVKEQFPEVSFLIVGGAVNTEEENFKKELENKVKQLSLSEQFIFTGFYPDLNYLFSNLEIVVIPSLYEAPSAIALEAMGMKKPVVASNAGGIPEVVVDGETGFLVPVRNPEAIAEKVIYLLKNLQVAKEMGEKGYQRVKENFTQEKLGREYEKLYDNLLKNAHRN